MKFMTTVRTTHAWPELPLAEWKDTYDTLHRWTRIIGKINRAKYKKIAEEHGAEIKAVYNITRDGLSPSLLHTSKMKYPAQATQ